MDSRAAAATDETVTPTLGAEYASGLDLAVLINGVSTVPASSSPLNRSFDDCVDR